MQSMIDGLKANNALQSRLEQMLAWIMSKSQCCESVSGKLNPPVT